MQPKKMFMRRVRVSVSIREERNNDSDEGRRLRDTVKLLHYLHDIVEVFDDVITIDFIEIILRKGIRKPVEIVNDIRLRSWIYVDAD